MKRLLNLKAAAVLVAVAAAGGIAVATAATGSSVTPNTSGVGGSAPKLGAAIALPVPTLVSSVTGAGAKATVVGAVGSGAHRALLLAVEQGGLTCFTASHADGAIVEPLNCAQDAYLRVWDDMSGSGDVATGVSSQRVLTLASAEVDAVVFALADGTTKTLTPDANGVAALETSSAAARVVGVTALDAGGQALAQVGT